MGTDRFRKNDFIREVAIWLGITVVVAAVGLLFVDVARVVWAAIMALVFVALVARSYVRVRFSGASPFIQMLLGWIPLLLLVAAVLVLAAIW